MASKKTVPFFSVIIPTYNPKNYLPALLESISNNECLKQIEVIISDDCSDEPFDDVLKQFKNVKINVITNDHHTGFPRTGRQHGAEEAKGIWFCFADQDDCFLDNAFDKLYQFINTVKPTNYIMTDFIEEQTETGQKILRNRKSGWTHGKFYEKAFWDKYGICYDSIKYCEDINLTTKLDCLITVEKINVYEFNEPLYIWKRRKDSLSDIEYFKKSMPDYIKATLGVIIEYVDKYVTDASVIGILNVKFIVALLHVYFYYQSKSLSESKQELFRSIFVLQPIFSRFKWITGFKNGDILGFLNNELIGIYNQTRYEDSRQIPFIEQIAFKDWLKLYLD